MIKQIAHDAITEIQLARPPVNALDLDMLRALRKALDDGVASGARGLVLSGSTGMFSAGVDVPALLQLDHAGVVTYWREFFAVCATLANLPIPIVAAVTGHSPAGGAVLALFCDYRVMADGPYRIGLNEVQVGLTVPENIQLALRRVVGTYRAERLLVSGSLINAAEALACGLVDETTGVDQVTTRALFWLNGLLGLPSGAMLGTRKIARADLIAAYADPEAIPVDVFVDAFFTPETLSVLRQLVARLKNKG